MTENAVPFHISFTPNGNRRKAALQHISLEEAYIAGAMRGLDAAEWAQDVGVQHVTFFGLSCENLEKRPQDQLDALQEGAIQFCDAAVASGIQIHPFGKINEFEGDPKYERLYSRLRDLKSRPFDPSRFTIHVATNYSGRIQHELGAFMDTLHMVGFEQVRRDPMRYLLSGGVPPVDLAIRTGGEHRTSGLLPFQMAYAELHFTPVLWADFDRGEFDRALAWYRTQPRNFGK
ncbi:MAG: undecaprenyl diphosphate synthase family protein [Candidatus Pacebacteria bacterium]|nr:undecaprenyl diphosphate synthase family protein [Candidatus Paceibacterota bacterium]